MSAWVGTGQLLIGALPSTMNGLQALRRYLLDDANESVRHHIIMPLPGGQCCSNYSDAAVDFIIAKYAARLAG